MGLIGGSFAKATKTRTAHEVFGFDLDKDVMLMARLSGAMDAPLEDEKIAECDLILVALRPQASEIWVASHLEELSKGKCLVVDICGVKRGVSTAISKLAKEHGFRYIGGHPMAGKEVSGFVNSTDALFDGASMILTPDDTVDMKTLEMLKNYFIDLGFAGLTFTTPEEHDRIIAYTSQLAHIVSGAYVKSETAQKRRGFSAGSFRDMTRVARLDEDMWTELMLANADNLSMELQTLINNLQCYLDAIEAKDADALKSCLREGRPAKANAGGN